MSGAAIDTRGEHLLGMAAWAAADRGGRLAIEHVGLLGWVVSAGALGRGTGHELADAAAQLLGDLGYTPPPPATAEAVERVRAELTSRSHDLPAVLRSLYVGDRWPLVAILEGRADG